MKVDVADLDCIFLTYDEPLKEEFWVQIKNMVPWAKRVDGVKGSDAAHKAAAEESDTDRFILIDGDNIPEADFFNQTLDMPTEDYQRATYRWRARNTINGLMYGNGGVSSWTKDFVLNMKTHENSQGSDDTDVEFCFDPLYWAMHDCYSVTYPNGSPYHAWRAGFREGVKMCLNKGTKPSVDEFRDSVHRRNLDHLTVWHNIGCDIENGEWAMAGARQGTYMTMLTNWNYKHVQNFDKLAELWLTVESRHPREVIGSVSEELSASLDLPMADFSDTASAFFKQHYRSDWTNRGIMVREIDVIRQIEGW